MIGVIELVATKKIREGRYELVNTYPYNVFADVFGICGGDCGRCTACAKSAYSAHKDDCCDDCRDNNFKGDCAGDCDYFDDLWNCYPKGVVAAIETLTEREREAVRLRYTERMTWEQAGQALGEHEAFNAVTKERVRQIVEKALRKLRHPSRAKHMTLDSVICAAEGAAELARRERDILQTAYDELVDALKSVAPKVMEVDVSTAEQLPNVKMVFAVSVEDLDLSVRTYNCLKRGGSNTVGDIFNNAARYDVFGRTGEELFMNVKKPNDKNGCEFPLLLYCDKVRNLGRKSALELLENLRSRGAFRKGD